MTTMKRLPLLVVMAAMAAVGGIHGCASSPSGAPAGTPAGETIEPGIAIATFDTIWSIVHNTYVDTAFVATRWSAVRDSLRGRALVIRTKAELDRLTKEMLRPIPDSHFYIIPASVAREVDPEDDSSSAGGTTGVAVRIAADRALVWRVEPGGPGEIARVKPGDRVERMGSWKVTPSIRAVLALPEQSRQRALSDLLRKMNAALSPAVGDTIRIRVTGPREGRAAERTLVAVQPHGAVSRYGNLPPIAALVRVSRVPMVTGGENGRATCAGTIAFNIWLPVLVPELERAVDGVADCAGIIIDLRGNSGGLGAMVMGFGGYFVDSAVSLGTMRLRQQSLSFVINPQRSRASGARSSTFSGPLAILVDPMSASTSEIFAAGLQRIGRARVFGERSAGAALPSVANRLASDDVFVHAIADFFDPAGGRIEGTGVIPDEIVALRADDLSNRRDAPLEAAVRWIAANAAPEK